VLIGTTRMSLQDLETFNRQQSTEYKLNANDCRHFVNAAIKEATGKDLALACIMSVPCLRNCID
jgi:hypothetical protein